MELKSTNKDDRQELWSTKRLFFCTPDLLKNDLSTGKCPSNRWVAPTFPMQLPAAACWSPPAMCACAFARVYVCVCVCLCLCTCESMGQVQLI